MRTFVIHWKYYSMRQWKFLIGWKYIVQILSIFFKCFIFLNPRFSLESGHSEVRGNPNFLHWNAQHAEDKHYSKIIYLFKSIPKTLAVRLQTSGASKNPDWTSSLPIIYLRNRDPLKVLNYTKLILNVQGGHSDSFEVNLELFRTFRGTLFPTKSWKNSFLEAWYIRKCIHFQNSILHDLQLTLLGGTFS